MGVEPNERLGNRNLELRRDHPGCLVNHVLEVCADFELGGKAVGRRVGLQHENRLRGDVGHDQRVSVLVVGQRTGRRSIEIERTEPNRPNLHRKAKHRTAPAAIAGSRNASHRGFTGSTRSGSTTG